MLTGYFRQEKKWEVNFSNYMKWKKFIWYSLLNVYLSVLHSFYFNKVDEITQGNICELHVLIKSIQIKVKHIWLSYVSVMRQTCGDCPWTGAGVVAQFLWTSSMAKR